MKTLPAPRLHGLMLTLSLSVCCLLSGCARREATGDGRVHVTCWTMWTGPEEAAMQQVVDAFNRSQGRIFVEHVSVSDITRQLALVTVGGNPPDVVCAYSADLATLADSGVIEPLESFMRVDGIDPDAWMARFAPLLADFCRYRGHIYAQPIAAFAVTLHWNKRLFREAGLDPERPPRTFAEFEEYARRLTRRDPQTGALVQMGFHPGWSGGGGFLFGFWMGGQLLANGEITIGRDPGFRRMMRWTEGISRENGEEKRELTKFASGFGSPYSAQSPFLVGKLAMDSNGDFFANWVRQYSPGFEFGVAPWPEIDAGEPPYAFVTSDPLMIPRGARHGTEAWQFIKYLVSPNLAARGRDELQGAELLAFLQCKSSPLREWSPGFTASHPNPYISVSRQLIASPGAVTYPNMGIWLEYSRELDTAWEKVGLLQQSPDDALAYVQQRIERSWQRHRATLERRDRAKQ